MRLFIREHMRVGSARICAFVSMRESGSAAFVSRRRRCCVRFVHLRERNSARELLHRGTDDVTLVARGVLERVKVEHLVLDAYGAQEFEDRPAERPREAGGTCVCKLRRVSGVGRWARVLQDCGCRAVGLLR